MTTATGCDSRMAVGTIFAEAAGPNGAAAGTAATTGITGQPAKRAEGKLQAFEGFLNRVGKTAGVVLSDLVKYVVPVAQVAALVDPAVSPEVAAFTASVHLVQTTVLSTQQRWASAGTAANTQKLADVLTVVEQPIILLFAQAGFHVDTEYVVNLVNGVVALLNAQPAAALITASSAPSVA